MTQEDKELLLKDICSRLPYGVKLQHVKNTKSIVELYSIDLDDFYYKIQFYTYKGKALTASDEGKLLKPGGMLRYKPCLSPLSNMTDEQKREVTDRWGINENFNFEIDPDWGKYFVELSDALGFINWCYENHLDINGLIPKGLANDATNLNIY